MDSRFPSSEGSFELPRKTALNEFVRRLHGLRPNEKAEPPPTRDVDRDSGTASANGGWLRRLVERSRCAGRTIKGARERQEFQTPGYDKYPFQSNSPTPKVH